MMLLNLYAHQLAADILTVFFGGITRRRQIPQRCQLGSPRQHLKGKSYCEI